MHRHPILHLPRVLGLALALSSLTTALVQAATITVDSTADTAVGGDGDCTLREAIVNANQNADSTAGDCTAGASGVTDTIAFDISGAGPATLVVAAGGLPSVTDPVTIDGTTQPGNTGVCTTSIPDRPDYGLVVESDGVGNGFDLTTGSNGSTIRGLNIHGFSNFAVAVRGDSVGNLVECNFIGTNEDGSEPRPDTDLALWFTNSSRNGTARYNLLSGSIVGLRVSGSTSNHLAYGNFVGTDRSGTSAIPNGTGVFVKEGTSFRLGGPDAPNVISGNDGIGVQLGGAPTTVVHNLIGTDPSGTLPVPNDRGIVLSGSGHTVGGEGATGRNVVSGNTSHGLEIPAASSGSSVRNNFIGTDAAGTAAVPNGGHGVLVQGPANYIGTIDEIDPGNVVSGNTLDGISVSGSSAIGNRIYNNRIGTDAAGTAALGNQGNGVSIGDGASEGRVGFRRGETGNVIAGNVANGLVLGGGDGVGDTLVYGNTIGTDASGALELGNGGHGILITSEVETTVVGDQHPDPDFWNVLAFNAGDGLAITESSSRGLFAGRNLFYGNGGLGIDLGDDGPTANDEGDGDGGPNRRQNFPELTAEIDCDGELWATFVVPSDAAASENHTVLIFAADADGEEGREILIGTNYSGYPAATTKSLGLAADLGVGLGDELVALAVAPTEDTSEFSPAAVVEASCRLAVTSTGDSGDGTLRQALLDANDALVPVAIDFDLPGDGPHVIAPDTALPTILGRVAIDGSSQDLASEVCVSAIGDRPSYRVVLEGSGLSLGAGSDGSAIRGLNVRGATSAIAIADSGGHTIECNFLGTDATGTTAEGNGIAISVAGIGENTVGGEDDGSANLIAFNDHGIVIADPSSLRNELRGNRFGGNTNLAIDLGLPGFDGEDADDADEGANRLLNHPASFGTDIVAGQLRISVGVDAEADAATFPITVDVYRADEDGDEGLELLLTGTVDEGGIETLTGPAADLDVDDGDRLVLLATDAEGNTSEFGPAVQVYQSPVDLSVEIGEAAEPVVAGSSQTYTVTVTNRETFYPALGFEVALGLVLPDGARVESITPSLGSFVDPVWTVTDLLHASETAVLEVRISVDGDTPPGIDTLAVDAVISTRDEPDPMPSNDGASASTSIVWPSTDLSVLQTGAGSVVAGRTATVTVTVANAGPSASTGSSLAQVLPAGWTLVGSTGDCADDGNDPGTLTCVVGALPSGASSAFDVTLGVPASQAAAIVASTASVAPTGFESDPTPADAVHTLETTVSREVDLSVSIQESADPVESGSGDGNLVYTATLTNEGPSDASGIVVAISSSLPTGTTVDSVVPGLGTWSESAWTPGALAAGSSATLTTTLTVAPPTSSGETLEWTATIQSVDETETDPSDDSTTEETSVDGSPDLTLAATAGAGPAGPGDTVSTQLDWENVGTDSASGVVLTATLPENTELDAAGSTEGWACSAASRSGGTCTLDLGEVPAGSEGSATFAVILSPELPGATTLVVIEASIADDGSHGGDADPSDNSASASLVVDAAPPIVTSVDSVSSAAGGRIADGDVVDVPVTQLVLAFSEEVEGADGADSFRVVRGGPDGELSTSSCAAAPSGDDELLSIESVEEDDGRTFLQLSDGRALGAGLLRLLACAERITDAVGLTLDGDGSGAAGGDFLLELRIATSGWIENPNFDDGLAPWTSPDFVWAPEDRDTAPTSGSADVLLPDEDRSLIHPCLALEEATGFEGSLAAEIVDPSAGTPSVGLALAFYASTDCSDTAITVEVAAAVAGDTGGLWADSRGLLGVPEGAGSVRPEVWLVPGGSSPAAVRVDRVEVVGLDLVFANGFESGDASSWTVP